MGFLNLVVSKAPGEVFLFVFLYGGEEFPEILF